MKNDNFSDFYLPPELDFDPDDDVQNENDDDMPDHEGHRDRLRRQLSKNRLDELKPPALLEFMLGCVLPRQDVLPVARTMMEQFGDLRTLLQGDLNQFLQVKGLGEAGARWMDLVCRSMAAFRQAQVLPKIVVSNYGQLRRYAASLLPYFRAPCCVLVLCDDADHVILRRPLVHGLDWGGIEILGIAANNASGLHAASAYLLVFTRDARKHPNRQDMQNLRRFSQLMQYTPCTLRDVLFMDENSCLSLRHAGVIFPENPRSLRVAEKNSVNPPGDALILRTQSASGERITTRIPICDLEVENERTEPV